MFGHTLQSSVLLNIGNAPYDGRNDKHFWEAYICQVSFMCVIMCHIPFIFFAGKEALLTSIDEISHKSVSNALETRLGSGINFESDQS